MNTLFRGAALGLVVCAASAMAEAPLGSVRLGGGLDVRNSTFSGHAQSGVLAPAIRFDAEGWFLPFLGVELDLLSEVVGSTCCEGVNGESLRFTGGRAGLATRYVFDSGFSLRAGLGYGGVSIPVVAMQLPSAISSSGVTARLEAAFDGERFQASASGVVLVPVHGSQLVTSVEPRVWAAVKLFDVGVSRWWLGVDGAALIETGGSTYNGVTARVGLGLRVALHMPRGASALTAPPLPLDGTLALKVSLPDGTPASGARVAIDGTVSRVTDAAGSASLIVPPGSHELRVQREGFRVHTQRIESLEGRELTVALTLEVPTGPGRVAGSVFDSSTLQPIANARVIAAEKEVRTSKEGTFTIDGVGPGPVRVRAEALGYAQMEEVVQVPPEAEARLTIGAEPVGRGTPAVIRGLVRSRVSNTVQPTVRVQGHNEPVVLSPEGRFVLTLPPGSYTLTVTAPGHLPQAKRFDLAPGEQAVFHVELHKQ